MNWVLVILVFTIPSGHQLPDRSYRDRIELGPFQTEADCKRTIPQVRFESFPRTEDVSYDMHEVRCEKVSAPPTAKPVHP